VDNRVFESKARRAENRRQFTAGLVDQCRQAPPTSASPVFLGMKRALEQLRALDCDPQSTCALYVTSDGNETAEARIARALAVRERTTVLPEPLANDGVRVFMCGFSEIASSRGGPKTGGAERADRMRRVWSALLSDPELLTLEPFCHA
jgi:hypothetical protein